MISPALFSARQADWETPEWLYAALDREFGFTVDGAADLTNHKAPRWFGPDSPDGITDALAVSWDDEVVYLNPPYGRGVEAWVAKAFHEARQGRATTVCLLPARTDTGWWHRYVMAASEVRFIRGRLRFVGAQASAPFPSVIVVFRRGDVPTCPAWRTMRQPLGGVRNQRKGGESLPATSHVPDTPPHLVSFAYNSEQANVRSSRRLEGGIA